MSKIDNITQDLLVKVRTVSDFTNRVGLAVGGTEIDPINIDLPRPAAWVVFTGTPILYSSPTTTSTVSVNYTYVVKVLIDYGDEATMITSDFPVLENIIENSPVPIEILDEDTDFMNLLNQNKDE